MLGRGEGATAPVVIDQGTNVQHVITATLKNGQVVFIDSQIGEIAVLKPDVKVQVGKQ